MSLKFKIDENLPAEVSELLCKAGHDAISVIAQGLRGASDPSIADVCRREARAIVTLDLDFANIRNYPPSLYHGIVVLRLASLDKTRVLRAVSRLLAVFETEQLIAKLWVVEETSIRIRS